MSLYVDKWYVANSEFENVVFGRDLRDGMIVLLEDEMLRVDVDRIADGYERARADEVNRWCTVTAYRFIPRPDCGSGLVKFIGAYPDGSLRVRTYDESYGWIVKKDAPAGGWYPETGQ